MARRPHASPHPIRNQKPAFLVTELSSNLIGNQKHPFLVTEHSSNPIGNQNTAFLVTEFHAARSNRRSELALRPGPSRKRPPCVPLVIFAASPPSAPPLHGVLMGKVYFYALDLARISASQALPMCKVPTTKLDLARSGPTKRNSGSLPENASRSGEPEGRAREGRVWEGRSTAAPPPLGGRSGGYNQAGCGEQHPRRALLAGLLLPAASGGVEKCPGL